MSRRHVMPTRIENRRDAYAERWWLHVEPRSEMRGALAGLSRFIATPTHHQAPPVRLARRADPAGSCQLIVFARDDDYFFGVLHSSVHELWARATRARSCEVESGFRYTPTTTFETFPFPDAPGRGDRGGSGGSRSARHASRRLAQPARPAEAELARARSRTSTTNVLRGWLRRTSDSTAPFMPPMAGITHWTRRDSCPAREVERRPGRGSRIDIGAWSA